VNRKGTTPTCSLEMCVSKRAGYGQCPSLDEPYRTLRGGTEGCGIEDDVLCATPGVDACFDHNATDTDQVSTHKAVIEDGLKSPLITEPVRLIKCTSDKQYEYHDHHPTAAAAAETLARFTFHCWCWCWCCCWRWWRWWEPGAAGASLPPA